MTGIATFIRKVDHFNGDARLYRLDPPIPFGYTEWGDNDLDEGEGTRPTTEYVIVSALDRAFDTGRPETYIFPSDESGVVLGWGELEGSFRGDTDHVRALNGAGYDVVSVEV